MPEPIPTQTIGDQLGAAAAPGAVPEQGWGPYSIIGQVQRQQADPSTPLGRLAKLFDPMRQQIEASPFMQRLRPLRDQWRAQTDASPFGQMMRRLQALSWQSPPGAAAPAPAAAPPVEAPIPVTDPGPTSDMQPPPTPLQAAPGVVGMRGLLKQPEVGIGISRTPISGGFASPTARRGGNPFQTVV